MRLALIDQIIILVYLLAIVGIGFSMKRKSAGGLSAYFLGNRQLPWWALAMSGSSSYFDITGTMWIVSLFIVLGMKSMWVHWLWGFPITAFYLGYMGKWIRRSGVITGAEWMQTRFGRGPAGSFARLAYTVFAVLTISALLGYGAIGMGKFGAVFLPFPPWICATLILCLTGCYVVVGGLHGIVRVEILQTIVLSSGAIAFAVMGWAQFDPAVFASRVPASWFSLAPSWRPADLQGVISGGTDYSLFGALVAVWLAKGILLCLSGPEQLYDFQRFLSARNERDASKLGALWGVIHTVRWPFAVAIAVMAIGGLNDPALDSALKRDPETALPLIIAARLPHGFAGLIMAALLSGFLATFSSTVNGGAAYLVRDLYQQYWRPKAAARELVWASYGASALLILTGLIISFFGGSINLAFLWIFGSLAAGILPANVLRWYWWRLNGWGYGAGIFGGMLLSLVQVCGDTWIWQKPLPLYLSFPTIAVCSTVLTIAVALFTRPTESPVLFQFCRTVRPAGWWSNFREAADERSGDNFGRDAFNTFLALIAITGLYLGTIYLVLHRYSASAVWLALTCGLTVGLYFSWYRHLPETEPSRKEEERPEPTAVN